MSSVLSPPPPIGGPRRRGNKSSRHRRLPSTTAAAILPNIPEAEASSSNSNSLGSRREEVPDHQLGRANNIATRKASGRSSAAQPATRSLPASMPLPTRTISYPSEPTEDAERDVDKIFQSGTGRAKSKPKPSTTASNSKYFNINDSPTSTPFTNVRGSHEIQVGTSTDWKDNQKEDQSSEKQRGKKRQRVSSDEDIKPSISVAEVRESGKGKGKAKASNSTSAGRATRSGQGQTNAFADDKLDVKAANGDVEQDQEGPADEKDVKRELKKPQKKKSKSISPTGTITSPLPINKHSTQQEAVPLSVVGNETTATATSSTSTTTTNSNSSSAQTARQLAERARVMKDREELSQIRKEKEEMGKKLEKAEKERDDVKKEVVGSKKEVGFKDEVIKSQDKVLDDIKETLTCNVCLEFFNDPHTIAPCGHTSCASCLLNWFESPNSLVYPVERDHGEARDALLGRTRACPTCRTPVVGKPMSAYVLNNLITAVKPRLLEASGSSGSIAARPAPAGQAVVDRTAMWDHIFENDGATNRRWHIDEADGGIPRCNDCGNEVEDQECTGCGRFFSDLDPDEDRDEERSEDSGYGGGDWRLGNIRIPDRPFYLPGHDAMSVDSLGSADLNDFDANLDDYDHDFENFISEDEDLDSFIVDDEDMDSPVAPRRRMNRFIDINRSNEESDTDDQENDEVSSFRSAPRQRSAARQSTARSQPRRSQIIISDDEQDSEQEQPTRHPSPRPRGGPSRHRVVLSDDDDEVQYVGASHAPARQAHPEMPGHLRIPGGWGEADVPDEEDDLSSSGSDGYGHYRNGYYEDSDGEIWSGDNYGGDGYQSEDDYGDGYDTGDE
ncbi:hypothetical protein FFLO_03071 [Filobasidium floriforme]|uniref:RING-type domain-containing protein n=1 Tax=Filobasidium floriforme TaxID=5210 RepID=A0A8K0JRQ6_9TREE|nr:hypothetical protein FFLO_03071 [Filobasidium floriforme]